MSVSTKNYCILLLSAGTNQNLPIHRSIVGAGPVDSPQLHQPHK